MPEGVVRALAAAAIVLGLAGTARAEDGKPGWMPGPWFAGVHGGYAEMQSSDQYFASGTGYVLRLEAGRMFLSALSVSLDLQVTRLNGGFDVYSPSDPGASAYKVALRQISLGPRIDGWLLRGRVRVGFALVGMRSREEIDIVPHPGFPDRPNRVTTYDPVMLYVAQAGVVPVRWGGFELELGASYSKDSDDGAFNQRKWYSGWLGLRWRGPAAASSAARRSSPATAPAAAR